MNKPVKRKDVIIKKVLVIAAIIAATAVITHIYDSYVHGKDIQALEEKNVIMPTDKWGTIMLYDAESNKVVKYTGLMTFQEVQIMGETGVSINCGEAQLISSMMFDKATGVNK